MRNRERRTPLLRVGQYLKSVLVGDLVNFEEGTVTSLNNSGHGLLLRMSRPFDQGDILEVRFKSSDQESTTTILEVRQVDLAREAHVTQALISQLEAGKKGSPSLVLLLRIAKALGTTIEELVR